MLQWDDDLHICGSRLYLDSRQPRPDCFVFVSHAHADHIANHARLLATPATATLAEHRIGLAESEIVRLDYRTALDLDDDVTRLELRPAGHVLGSAMLHVTRPEGTLLYTGDFKLRASVTAERADPVQSDYLLMESTYGVPSFRFPPRQQVHEELVDRCSRALHEGRQPIVMGYSLGKAQEITRVLTDAGLRVTQHGAAYRITQLYEQLGVRVGPVRPYAFADFHGDSPLDLHERGVLVAPTHVARTPFVTRFKNPLRIVVTGWGLLKNAPYRYGVDHALPLSDHADFDELLELIEMVRPKRIFTHHGYPEFVDHLRARGLDAHLARPAAQLSLFD